MRKYESEMTLLKKFAYKYPGFGNLSKLPSGTAQLQQLRKPIVAKLWVEANPDCEGLDYDDPVALGVQIPPTWWLEHASCKYILSVLVHKDNKDISTQPATLPAGPKRKDIRNKKKSAIEQERASARLQRVASSRVASSGGSNLTDWLTDRTDRNDVDKEAKRVKVDGMRSVVNLKKIDAINTQIAVMERLENVCVCVFWPPVLGG